jgi:hypothetical protein
MVAVWMAEGAAGPSPKEPKCQGISGLAQALESKLVTSKDAAK